MKKQTNAYIKLAKTFPAYHPKAGQPTDFRAKRADGTKKYTIRENFEFWAKKIDQVRKGGRLYVQQWTGRPYYSEVETIDDLFYPKAYMLEFQQGTWGKITGAYVLDTTKLDEETISYVQAPLFSFAEHFGIETNGFEIKYIPVETLAKDDGLTESDFWNWFRIPIFRKKYCLIVFDEYNNPIL